MQEAALLVAVGEGEELLELVDHQQKRGVGRQLPSGCVQLVERVLSRHHPPYGPTLRAWNRTVPQRGDQPRHDHAGLATARGTDERDQASAIPQGTDEVRHQRLAAEEVAGVLLGEGSEPLVGIACGLG